MNRKNKWNTTVLFIPKQYCIVEKGKIIIALASLAYFQMRQKV